MGFSGFERYGFVLHDAERAILHSCKDFFYSGAEFVRFIYRTPPGRTAGE